MVLVYEDYVIKHHIIRLQFLNASRKIRQGLLKLPDKILLCPSTTFLKKVSEISPYFLLLLSIKIFSQRIF